MGKHTMHYLVKLGALSLASLSLISCGGGSDGSSPPDPSPPNWIQGVFESSDNFVNRCENPRSGIVEDAFGGMKQDLQGSILEENNWLRSWSNETYLWYDEIVDQNPANFSDPLDYFEVLKTEAITPSGKDKDEFHFTFDSEEYTRLVSSGDSAGYGAEFVILSSTPPRDIRIAFTDPDTPAAMADLQRGARILEVDGVDAINSNTEAEVEILNDALRPDDGTSHTFVVTDFGSNNSRAITMTAEVLNQAPVQNQKIINTPSGDVAYLTFNTFGTQTAEEALFNAFTDFQNAGVSDLILDLRYNGGGFTFISAQLAYMIAGPTNTAGKTYEQNIFNDKIGAGSPLEFVSEGIGFTVPEGTPLPTLNLNRVYILATGGTCSASEAVINGLRGIDIEVILIGETTCGKPFGFSGTDNCSTTYFTVQFQAVNDKGFGDYADGFAPENSQSQFAVSLPGCQVADDYSKLLGDESESLLKAALDYRSTGLCPSPTAKTFSQSSLSRIGGDPQSLDILSDQKSRILKHLKERRIYSSQEQ